MVLKVSLGTLDHLDTKEKEDQQVNTLIETKHLDTLFAIKLFK